MRRFVFIFILMCGAACAMLACSRAGDMPQTGIRLYFVDAQLNRLLPYDDTVPDTDTEHMARSALDKLTEGRDDNDSIRRLLPKDKQCLSVYVREDIAYVDLASAICGYTEPSRDTERLIIYQITNTLTEIKGIQYVKFTVDGEIHKDFMGYYDMRETYKYNYPE